VYQLFDFYISDLYSALGGDGPDMSSFSVELRSITTLLASLLRQLAEAGALSYHDQAMASGVSRNVIYNFAKRSDNPTSIKTSDLSKLIDWYQSVDFYGPQFTSDQQDTAAAIHRILNGDEPRIVEILSDSFVLEETSAVELKKLFGNYLLGFRQRGTTEHFQVSVHKFELQKTNTVMGWTMTFLQGEAQSDSGEPPERDEQDLAFVEGVISRNDETLTCFGRRAGAKSINLLNLFLPSGIESLRGKVLRGTYCTYSRYEAISRVMFFIDSGVSIEKSLGKFTGKYGDLHTTKIKEKYPLIYEATHNSFLGYSINEKEVKLHPEVCTTPGQNSN
jgi:hypothetical protein